MKFHGPDIEASYLGLHGQVDDFQESNMSPVMVQKLLINIILLAVRCPDQLIRILINPLKF